MPMLLPIWQVEKLRANEGSLRDNQRQLRSALQQKLEEHAQLIEVISELTAQVRRSRSAGSSCWGVAHSCPGFSMQLRGCMPEGSRGCEDAIAGSCWGWLSVACLSWVQDCFGSTRL